MIRAMVVKELRTTLPITVVGLAIVGLLVATSLQSWRVVTPFVADGFLELWSLCAVALAFALALVQSSWERGRGTDLFLLHRPARRWAIFGIKIAVGLALLLSAACLPIWLRAVWISEMHRHGPRFAWWMTEPAWRVWLALPVVYLAAFISGLLPGPWRGVRLLPLVVAGGSAMWLNAPAKTQQFANSHQWVVGSPGWAVVLVCSAAASVALGYVILKVAANRDFG